MAAIATRMDATWGEILDAVLPVSTHGIAGSYRESILTAGLSDRERDCISAATGMDRRARCHDLSERYTSQVVTIDSVTRRARTPWGLVYRQRFCPLA